MRLLKRSSLVAFAQTQEEFDTQVSGFLLTNGFEDTPELRACFASFVQHMPEDADSFDPAKMARCIRKAKANEYAFYNIKPERRPKPVAKDVTNEQPEEASAPVVQQVKA